MPGPYLTVIILTNVGFAAIFLFLNRQQRARSLRCLAGAWLIEAARAGILLAAQITPDLSYHWFIVLELLFPVLTYLLIYACWDLVGRQAPPKWWLWCTAATVLLLISINIVGGLPTPSDWVRAYYAGLTNSVILFVPGALARYVAAGWFIGYWRRTKLPGALIMAGCMIPHATLCLVVPVQTYYDYHPSIGYLLWFLQVFGLSVAAVILVFSVQNEALRDSHGRLQEFIHSLDAIVWESDAETWQFDYVSQRAEAILGYPTGRWLEESGFWMKTIHPDDRQQAAAHCRDAVARGKDHQFEYRALHADGRIVWISDTVRIIPDRSGKARKLRGLMIDITGRKQTEEQLLQSQKMDAVGQLAGGIAHDFNNLLTAIIGYSEMLASQLPADGELAADVREIQGAAERATSLTAQLLAFSRKQVLRPTVVDINQVVLETSKLLQRILGEDVELVLQPSRDLDLVKADRGQLGQVLMNLVVNARDALPNGGRIVLKTANTTLPNRESERGVVLTVSDNGIGMNSEVLSHIFEPFFTTKGPGKGTGLGLAMVFGIIKQSNGDIEVESRPGKGTSFRVYLPSTMAGSEMRARPAEPVHVGGGETILLVDDDRGVRELAQRILEKNGYRVFGSASPFEALRMCEEGNIHFDLLFTDVRMPGMTGIKLREVLRARFPNLKVLFMSGYSAEMSAEVLDDGAAGRSFLAKPFTPNTLLGKVREVLDS